MQSYSWSEKRFGGFQKERTPRQKGGGTSSHKCWEREGGSISLRSMETPRKWGKLASQGTAKRVLQGSWGVEGSVKRELTGKRKRTTRTCSKITLKGKEKGWGGRQSCNGVLLRRESHLGKAGLSHKKKGTDRKRGEVKRGRGWNCVQPEKRLRRIIQAAEPVDRTYF